MKNLVMRLQEESIPDRWTPVVQRPSKNHPVVGQAWECSAGQGIYRITHDPEDDKYHLDLYVAKDVQHLSAFPSAIAADAAVTNHVG